MDYAGAMTPPKTTWTRWAGLLCAAVLQGAAAHAAEPVAVRLPSLDAPDGQPLVLPGWRFAPPRGEADTAVEADSVRPAVLMFHGCGGMLDGQGRPSPRIRAYADWLTQQGWHVLAVDSLSPRGEKELCTQRTGTRRVTLTQRRLDALGALQWMAQQPGVDASRMALLGWSNGGSTVLAAANLRHRAVARARPAIRLAVAFYPGCEAELRRGYEPAADTLLLLGGADDWTPAAPCQQLAAPRVAVRVWDDAYHGFDGAGPLVLRKDVPNGVNPGEGVHVGGHPQAREEARQVLLQALRRAFGPAGD